MVLSISIRQWWSSGDGGKNGGVRCRRTRSSRVISWQTLASHTLTRALWFPLRVFAENPGPKAVDEVHLTLDPSPARRRRTGGRRGTRRVLVGSSVALISSGRHDRRNGLPAP